MFFYFYCCIILFATLSLKYGNELRMWGTREVTVPKFPFDTENTHQHPWHLCSTTSGRENTSVRRSSQCLNNRSQDFFFLNLGPSPSSHVCSSGDSLFHLFSQTTACWPLTVRSGFHGLQFTKCGADTVTTGTTGSQQSWSLIRSSMSLCVFGNNVFTDRTKSWVTLGKVLSSVVVVFFCFFFFLFKPVLL